MMLMKIRFGTDFSTRAGATWRLLFVLALFPWLRKYRFPQIPPLPNELDLPRGISETDLMEEGHVEEGSRRESDDLSCDGKVDPDQSNKGVEKGIVTVEDKVLTTDLITDGEKEDPFAVFLSWFQFGPRNSQSGPQAQPAISRSSTVCIVQDDVSDVAVEGFHAGQRSRNSGVDKGTRQTANVRFADDAMMQRERSALNFSNTNEVSRLSGRRPRQSLADMSAGVGGIQDRDVLIQMENESLKKQVVHLQEQVQALIARQQEKKNK
jgi:hypothetical protein